MPTSPKSSTPHSRLPSTPTSSKRAPQRLKLTPKRQLQTPKRLPSTPQQPSKPMTPKRNPQTTLRVSRRKTTDDTAPPKTPKRNNDTDDASDLSKKRKVRKPPARVPSTPLAVTKSAKRSGKKAIPTAKKEEMVMSSGSAKKPEEKKKRRSELIQTAKKEEMVTQSGSAKKPEEKKKQKSELNVGKSKKDRTKQSAEKDGDEFNSPDVDPSPKAPLTTKKTTSAHSLSNSVVKKSGSKKLSQSLKQHDENDKPKASVDNSAEPVNLTRDDEETPKKRKSRKKRSAPGKFDLPTEGDERNERSLVKRLKKDAQVGKDEAILSPKITVNESMTESKLKLLEASPLNRLIAENDRKAAAAEVAAQGKETGGGQKADGLGSSASFIPVDRSTANTDRTEGLKATNTAVGKKKDRKKRGKNKGERKGEAVLDKDDSDSENKRGVMYLGHIPHGFYEKEMRSYFSQFGTVTKLKLSRSRKTGGCRGYAFLEFSDPEVASIAAEAMDGYLMHGQSLVAKVVPNDKVHPETFKDADKKFKKIPWSTIERSKMIARAKDPLKLAMRSRRVKKVTKNRMKRLADKGIKYDFPEISA